MTDPALEKECRALRPSLWLTVHGRYILAELDKERVRIQRMERFLLAKDLLDEYRGTVEHR